MKLKKILASVAASAIAMSALAAIPANAADDVTIDFEDGNCSFASMKTDDGGDASLLSVVDYNGSKALMIDVQDCSLIPKVQLMVADMVGVDNMSVIKTIEFELTIASEDGTTPPGWGGGGLGTQGGAEENPGWSQGDWTLEEYEAAAKTDVISRTILLPTQMFVDGVADAHIMLMRWASEVPYDMYIDNIKLLDADGNVIKLAATETTEEVPVADNTTTATTTGNTTVAVMTSLMAVAAVAAVAAKKRK